MNDMTQRIAMALQGFGAGVQGQGPYFQHMLNANQQQLSEGRKMAMVQDAYSVMQNLQSGNIPTARATLINRLGILKQLGGDPSDTLGVLQKIESGDVKGALDDVSTVVNFAQANGMLKLPQNAQPKTQIVNGQAVTIDPTGKATAAPIENFVQPQPKTSAPKTQIVDGQLITVDPMTGQATAAPVQNFKKDRTDINLRIRDQQLREQQLQIQRAAEERMANKMSAPAEKVMHDSQNKAYESNKDWQSLELLANDYASRKFPSGVKAKFSEQLKAVLGNQDVDVSEVYRKFNKVRMSEAIKALPTGNTTDADIRNALKGVPDEHTNPAVAESFLRGAAKIARMDAAYNQFRADFMGKHGHGRGFNQAWRAKIYAPTIKENTTIAEIYEAAQVRGISPDDLMQQLGIKDGGF